MRISPAPPSDPLELVAAVRAVPPHRRRDAIREAHSVVERLIDARDALAAAIVSVRTSRCDGTVRSARAVVSADRRRDAAHARYVAALDAYRAFAADLDRFWRGPDLRVIGGDA